jgi:hypothetical protein
MYVKRYVVKRGAKRYAYLRLVESYRDEHGRPRHRIVANLGREDELKASGQLEQLAGSFARLDPPLLGVRREVGPLLLVADYLGRLGLRELVDRQLPQRGRAQLTTGEVVTALVCNRLCSPSPLYDVAGWASGAALQELSGVPAMLLNDDRLGRALDAFAPVAEEVRGAACLAAIERFRAEAGRLHLDLTALRVAGAYERSALVGKGWGPDGVARQVRVLEAVNGEGVPLYVRPQPGDASELACLGAGLERLAALLPPGLAVCADSALGNWKTLLAADRAGLRFLCPLRSVTGFAERFLDEVGFDALRPLRYVSRRDRRLSPAQRTRYRGALRAWELSDGETGAARRFRVAYIWSSEEARSVAEGRERALRSAEDALARVQRGLGGRHYPTRKHVEARVAQILPPVRGLLDVESGTRGSKPTLRFARNEQAIAAAAAADGVYALATNLRGRLTAGTLLRLYKEQSIVERRYRDLKGPLRVRPIFLQNDERIDALLSIVGLALLVFGLIEADLRRALGEDDELPGLLPEGRAARPTGGNVLAAFQGLGLTYTREGAVLDRLTATQRRILSLLEVAIPWPEQRARHC